MTHVLYPTTNLQSQEQLKLVTGRGVYVYDDRGKRYLEGMAGLWCVSLGYGNEELIEIATKQYRDLSFGHLFGGKTHQPAIDLAGKLADMVDIPDAKVFFGNSGSDANDTLLKCIRYFNQSQGRATKRKIIARDRAYHGVTMASSTLTGLAINHTHFDLPFDDLKILRAEAPHFYRNSLPGETQAQFCQRLVTQLEEMLQAEGPDTIAAFVAEPINGAGGVIVPPAGYFQAVQQLLNKHDILFLDDEVICAFGRTGADFGATTFQIKPDCMSLAKGLSSAYFPISASVISGEIYSQIEAASRELGLFGHGYTYSGHPVGCALALKTLEIYERDNLYQHAATLGAYLHQKLDEKVGAFACVGEIRGMGLIAAIQFVANRDTKTFFDNHRFAQLCQSACEQNGLILRALSDNSLAICPPLIIDKEQIDELVDILTESIDEVMRYHFIV